MYTPTKSQINKYIANFRKRTKSIFDSYINSNIPVAFVWMMSLWVAKGI